MTEQLETRIAAVELQIAELRTKFKEEIDRLYTAVLPDIDSQIERAINYACETSSHALDESQKSVVELGDRVVQTEAATAARLQSTIDTVKSLESKAADQIREAVDKLVASSGNEIVAKTLLRALTSTILKTRPASREELRSAKDVLVVRQASAQEIREQ